MCENIAKRAISPQPMSALHRFCCNENHSMSAAS